MDPEPLSRPDLIQSVSRALHILDDCGGEALIKSWNADGARRQTGTSSARIVPDCKHA